MKKANILVLFILMVGLTLSGCGAAHNKYRGVENAPFARITPLQVDPNQIQSMSPHEFDEYMRRVKTYNNYVRDTAYANGYYAYSEKQWVNHEEGGPPLPPDVASAGGGKAPKRKATALEKEKEKAIKDFSSTLRKETNKAWKNFLKGVFD